MGNTSFHRGKEEQMADTYNGSSIKPEVAAHLAESMERPALPTPETLAVTSAMGGAKQWPDGNGKRRHTREHGASPGRLGQGAAVTAIHRTSRPQMPHSS
jgi:hypothetical protein